MTTPTATAITIVIVVLDDVCSLNVAGMAVEGRYLLGETLLLDSGVSNPIGCTEAESGTLLMAGLVYPNMELVAVVLGDVSC